MADLPFRGRWGLSGQERQWPGTLNYTNGRLVLDLDLPSDVDVMSGELQELALLHGETNNGKAITVVDAGAANTRIHFPGVTEVVYRPRYAVVGAWFDPRDEIAFDELHIHLQLLDSYLDVSGFDVDLLDTTVGYDVRYRLPETIPLADANGLTIEAQFSASSPTFVRPLVDVPLRQRGRLKLSSPAKQQLDDDEETIRRIRNFLSFATRHDAPVEEMAGRTDVDVHRAGSEVATEAMWLEILPREKPEPGEDVPAYEMLLHPDDNPDAGGSALTGWLKHYEALGSIFELYLITVYQRRIYLHLQFLSLAQAIESLHTRRFPDHELPKQEFNERVRRAVDAAPADLQAWLAEKLDGRNLAPFRKSVEELARTLPPILLDRIGDVEGFSRLVGYTRNYYTHWTTRLEKKAAKDQELMRLTMALRLIVEALILLELGYSVDQANELLKRNIRIGKEIGFAFEAPLRR